MYGRRWRSNIDYIDGKKQDLFENVNGTHSIMPEKRRAKITSPTGPNHNGPLKVGPTPYSLSTNRPFHSHYLYLSPLNQNNLAAH